MVAPYHTIARCVAPVGSALSSGHLTAAYLWKKTAVGLVIIMIPAAASFYGVQLELRKVGLRPTLRKIWLVMLKQPRIQVKSLTSENAKYSPLRVALWTYFGALFAVGLWIVFH